MVRRGPTTHQGSRRQDSKGCGDGVGRTKKMAGKWGWEASCASSAKRQQLSPHPNGYSTSSSLFLFPDVSMRCHQEATVPATHCHDAPSLLT